MGTLSTTATLPCVTYSRVSTDDQVQAYGLTSQRHELRELARRKGYPVAAELSDEASAAPRSIARRLPNCATACVTAATASCSCTHPTGSRGRLSTSSCSSRNSSGPAPASSS